MAIERKCPGCGLGPSANRAGKPGLCTSCIDNHFRDLRVEPLDEHKSPRAPRRYKCVDCGSLGKIPFADIRSRTIRLCERCLCRELFEAGVASDPDHWNLSKRQAAQVVLGDQFLAVGDDGDLLDAECLAARMANVWDLFQIECITCKFRMLWSISMALSGRANPLMPDCFNCGSQQMAALQDELFETHGLTRDHIGYARLSDPVAAHCSAPACGAERRISLVDLRRGVTPCLNCAELADPNALHIVYKLHFPALRAYKVGITNTEARHDRIASHISHGGILLESCEVPNREAAQTAEDTVLRSVRGFPSSCTPKDMPQGGYTETWSDTGPNIDLRQAINLLKSEAAPGFDRLEKLREYFKDAPVTIDEFVPFRQVTVEEVDGVQMHHIGFSEPLEQVLRKIRAQRG
ncbi:hypothetical protein [Kitasatospora purpeofusca]|uniref:hypothetical protein n=1 Tax=Kitasatospora purpeofusca TaxID=67352 RepID=UPI003656F5B6